MPIDTETVSLIKKISAENKYLIEGRENEQIIPSLMYFMTGRFYIVILFMKLFHGSADFELKARVQNKRIVRRLFGSILISYMSEVSQHRPLF